MTEEKTTNEDPFLAKLDGLSSFMAASEIDGHVIKEWSTTQFTRLYPYLRALATELAEGGATIKNLRSYLGENWPKLVDAVIPHMVPIIMLSCPTVTQEYLDEHPFTNGLSFILAIFKANMDHLADFFARAGDLPEGLKTEVIEQMQNNLKPK
jgi:hypothetical protein